MARSSPDPTSAVASSGGISLGSSRSANPERSNIPSGVLSSKSPSVTVMRIGSTGCPSRQQKPVTLRPVGRSSTSVTMTG